jgi:hypothetical protein
VLPARRIAVCSRRPLLSNTHSETVALSVNGFTASRVSRNTPIVTHWHLRTLLVTMNGQTSRLKSLSRSADQTYPHFVSDRRTQQ